MASPANSSLSEIFRLFLRLGLTAFGGPAAHIVLMQREAVERRGWMSRAQFLDLVGACNLLPGPGSTQVAMALGYSRTGWLGLIVLESASFCPPRWPHWPWPGPMCAMAAFPRRRECSTERSR